MRQTKKTLTLDPLFNLFFSGIKSMFPLFFFLLGRVMYGDTDFLNNDIMKKIKKMIFS